jgi:hypothetical protein
LSLGSATALICYSITNYAEGVYESRSGLITTGYLIALIGSARLLWEKEMIERSLIDAGNTIKHEENGEFFA